MSRLNGKLHRVNPTGQKRAHYSWRIPHLVSEPEDKIYAERERPVWAGRSQGSVGSNIGAGESTSVQSEIKTARRVAARRNKEEHSDVFGFDHWFNVRSSFAVLHAYATIGRRVA